MVNLFTPSQSALWILPCWNHCATTRYAGSRNGASRETVGISTRFDVCSCTTVRGKYHQQVGSAVTTMDSLPSLAANLWTPYPRVECKVHKYPATPANYIGFVQIGS